MSFNSFQSPYSPKPNPNSSDANLITNPGNYYQSTYQKPQTSKTSEFQPSQFTPPSSMNANYLNTGPRFPTNKFTPSNFDKRQEISRNSDLITAKSMVFMGTQNQSASSNIPKKTFAGLGKLSQMARTANKNFDDQGDFEHVRNSNLQQNSNNFQEEKGTTFKKYGNTLGQQFNSNLKPYHEKQPSVSSSMFFNVGQEKNNVYKSFINPGSNNNSGTDTKKAGGLDFLLKYKKEQQEKKQNELNNTYYSDKRIFESPKMNDNGNRNYQTPLQNGPYKISHEFSAPQLGHAAKNHFYEPVKVPLMNKNEPNLKTAHNQYESPVHNQHPQSPHGYTPFNNNKYSSPQQQQGPNHTFMRKFNSDKADRYNPVKTFGTQLNAPQNSHGVDSFPKTLAFAKKQKKVGQDFISTPEGNTPNKDKFMSPSFFKNKQNQFSEAKTLETIPSPTSPKVHQFSDGSESPGQFKSTISDDGSNDSIDYMNEDFSSDELKEWCLDDFELGDKLGKGAFGDVYFARQKNLGFMCVLKKMSKKRIKDLKRQEHVIRQLKIQMYLNHRHLTAMYGYFHDKDYIYLILEYLPDGNLAQIKKRKKTSQKQTADIVKQVCQGLAFMHKHDIIHRDIKPQNIFCNEGYVKLGDFGCSVFTDGMRKTVVSCLQYSSPEQLNGGCYNEKIDVWGIGILAYQLLTGRSPYEKQIMNMANQQVDFGSLKFPEELKLSPLAKDFIISLLNVDPIDRLDIDQALQHKFITSNYEEPIQLH